VAGVGTRKGEWGCLSGCVLYPYMKTVEIVLWKGEGGIGRMVERVNPTKIYFKNICQHHSVHSCTTIIC
jgi:hypothetical protein